MLWGRHLARDVWPSTPRAMDMQARLRRTVLYSAAAAGITGLVAQLFEVVVERHGVGIARPGWALFVISVALLVAAVTWLGTRPRHPKD